MSQKLVSRSPDLKRLRDEGYEVEVSPLNLLLVHGVPYVNSRKEIARGTLASELTLASDKTSTPSTHVALFTGDHPCNQDGSEIASIKHQAANQAVKEGLIAKHSFSNKPPNGYPDYFAKMTRYIDIISAPAQSIDKSVTAKTFNPVDAEGDDDVFNYLDTASSRAGVAELMEKLKPYKIGIIGVGGTGSYVLDLVAKTPVREIHLFDGDLYLQHNAFRSPGAPSKLQLEKKARKVDHFRELYSNMHNGIIPHPFHVDSSNVDVLAELDFVFICLDKGTPKTVIIPKLEEWNKPFIDVGMGIERVDDEKSLIGILRITTSTPAMRDHVRAKGRISFGAGEEDDEYRHNIQIADLNALTASLAVLKWKKICGFYQDHEREHDSTYTINVNLLTSEDVPE